MMIERMLYRARQIGTQQHNAFANEGILGRHQLTIKLLLHLFLVFLVHIQLGFLIPRHNLVPLSDKFSLLFIYTLWILYFIASSLQIRYGYP